MRQPWKNFSLILAVAIIAGVGLIIWQSGWLEPAAVSGPPATRTAVTPESIAADPAGQFSELVPEVTAISRGTVTPGPIQTAPPSIAPSRPATVSTTPAGSTGTPAASNSPEPTNSPPAPGGSGGPGGGGGFNTPTVTPSPPPTGNPPEPTPPVPSTPAGSGDIGEY